jgi:hypothetical protein
MLSNLSTLILTLEAASKAVNSLSEFGNIVKVSPHLAPLGLPQASLELQQTDWLSKDMLVGLATFG